MKEEVLVDRDEIDDELVAGSPQQRNWRGIGIALLVILLICALITVAVVLLTPDLYGSREFGSVITLEELLSRNFSSENTQAKWTNAGKLAYRASSHSIILLTPTDSGILSSELVDKTPFAQLHPVSGWYPSSNLGYMAYAHQAQRLFRYSWLALYNITSIKDGKAIQYESVGPTKNGKELLRTFLWNPETNSEDFVFVHKNDLYYQADPYSDAMAVSSTGDTLVFNGVADWLYEEEILDTDVAVWWSPDGDYIAYAEFNDTSVKPIKYPVYRDGASYPVIRSIPYSKAGEEIPTVRLMIWDKYKKNEEPFELQPPQEVSDLGDYYLLRVTWPSTKFLAFSERSLIAVWANRVQNITYFTICSYQSGQCVLNYKQEYAIHNMKLWAIPGNTEARFSTESSYFTLLPEQAGDKNVYLHIANITVPNGGANGRTVFLNAGNYDIKKIVSYDSNADEIYYLASAPLPRKTHLYKVGGKGSVSECVSCWMDESMECGQVDAVFGRDSDAHLLSCGGPGRPRKFLRKMSSNETLEVISNNTRLGEYLAKKALPVVRYETVKLHNGYALVKLSLPPGVDEPGFGDEVFPMIVRVYSGPGWQEVRESSRVGIDSYFVSNKRYAVAQIDGRSSGGRGWKYQAPVYRRFGTVEIEDQIYVAKELARRHTFIDRNKVAVWGWSYGGFATAKVVVDDRSKVFKCAVAVAPVTNFRYYDAAYTERYMGLPKDNYEGYDKTVVSRNVTAFRNRSFYLIHGTGDDNVHFQNSAMLAKALTRARVQFKFMVYPDQDHSIGADRPHLYTLLDTYFETCFKKA